MRFCIGILIIFFFQNCSFDKKSGIWNNQIETNKKTKDLFEDFETLSTFNNSFNKVINKKKNFNFKLDKPIKTSDWRDIFFSKSNNLDNFKYNNKNELIFKSKKLSNHNLSNYILIEKNKIVTSDTRGNLIFFSLSQNKVINIFNFYQKKFKKIEKKLNMILDRDTVYISDNLGYLYAFNYKTQKLVWAKNYKIPFRSNLKLYKDKLIASNQNNNLYYFNKNSGDIIKSIPTEETIIKNQFINNLSLDNENLIFLNTYGSLYSINNDTMKINWFINLNQSLDINPSNIFLGTEIIHNGSKIVLSSNQFTYVIDILSGSILFKKNFISLIKPTVINEYLFLISKNNLLISVNLNSSEIIYSININEQIAEFLNIKKKSAKFRNLFIVNNNIFVFLQNSYLLKFNINGKLLDVTKLRAKLNSNPIFIDGSIFFLNDKNKIIIID